MSGKNRVWILGAGFSRSLGGPLIGDLLAVREENVLRRHHRTALRDESKSVAESVAVRAVSENGHRKGLWQHAEEFLSVLETAAADEAASTMSYALRTIGALIEPTRPSPGAEVRQGASLAFKDVQSLLGAARRAVVADCSAFLLGHSLDHERWNPYKAWMAALTDADTIVTFNYDVVLEAIAKRVESRVSVVLPTDSEAQSQSRNNLTPIFKLHGSTNWYKSRESSFVQCDAGDTPPALANPALEPVMGFPGPSKMSLCENLLKPLWSKAMRAIEEASEVLFIGYRFPPTDSYSREQILASLFKGNPKRVVTVVGPESDDSRRLGHLLSHVLRPNVHIPKPLYCEDFLSVWKFEKERPTMWDDKALAGLARLAEGLPRAR